jgi:exodeoxyribonuclease VII small subunit
LPIDQSENHSLEAAASFEHSLAELEQIVHQLEDGQVPLAEALSRYEQGVKHLKHCYQLLAHAEQKIELLTGVAADGTPLTAPFGNDAPPLEEVPGRRRTRKSSSQPGSQSASLRATEAGDIDG